MDQDDVAFLPFTTFSRRIMGKDHIGVLMVSAVSEHRVDAATEQVTDIVRRRRHIIKGEDDRGEGDDFAGRDPREVQALLQTVTGILPTLLAGVATVSVVVVVGGIGVMNIMLVSVTERTRSRKLRLVIAFSGAVLVQIGAGIAGGCTSGLAISGGAVLVPRRPFSS